MRDIAFRAWTEFKTMVDVPTVNFATSEAVMPDGEWYKVKLMQWTGLVDKAGTRIYEGDILRQPHSDIMPRFIGKVVWLVVWLNEVDVPGRGGVCSYGYYIRGGKNPTTTSSLNPIQSEMFEVIGNIMENPELVK
jgi:uncharacterized phage protein (TIGR01671 family)